MVRCAACGEKKTKLIKVNVENAYTAFILSFLEIHHFYGCLKQVTSLFILCEIYTKIRQHDDPVVSTVTKKVRGSNQPQI